MKFIRSILFSLSFLVLSVSSAKLNYHSSQLVTKDLEEMNLLISQKIKVSEDDEKSDRLFKLREAAMLALSRPDDDGMVEKIFPQVRYALQDEDSYDEAMKVLVRDVIAYLKANETSSKDQVTYLVILENILSEFKPQLKNGGLAKDLYTLIRDAEIKISDKAKLERKLTSMKSSASPSDIALKILPKTK